MTERRELLIALGACTITAPLAAQAPQPTKPARVAWLAVSSPEAGGYLVDVFKRRMLELGYVEGKDVVYDLRWARGQAERFPELAQELVALHPNVIFASAGPAAVLAVQRVTRSIPIVGISLSDPVASGLANSLARPGGNVTGLSEQGYDISAKRLELLLAVVPKLNRVVVLRHPADPQALLPKILRNAAQSVGVDVVVMEVSSPDEIEAAFAHMTREHVGGVFPTGTTVNFAQRQLVADLAIRHRIPTMFANRAGPESGGLMSYGADITDVFRRAATYVDKILKGAKPGDLPIEQPTTFEFVINLKTAKGLGITIPLSLLLRADEVIQ
jgi:putative tryptophan/tyrosine transport system substrate-binding protein